MPSSRIAFSAIFLCGMFIALTGCGAIARQQQAQAVAEHREKLKQAGETARAIAQECKEKRLRGEPRTHVESVQCSNDRILTTYRAAGYPYMDLVGLVAAARLAGAEQIDRGQITEAQEQLQFAELNIRISNEERRRNLEIADAHNRAAMVSAAQNEAVATSAAALLQGLSAFEAATKPGTITCTTFGATTSCRWAGVKSCVVSR
jgi:hypothetical protein